MNASKRKTLRVARRASFLAGIMEDQTSAKTAAVPHITNLEVTPLESLRSLSGISPYTHRMTAQLFFCKLLEHQTEGWGWLSMLR
jgi:hypothetical protein